MRAIGILVVVAALAAGGYHYWPEILGYFDESADAARMAGDHLIEDAGPVMDAIARKAELQGSLQGAGAGIAVKPSGRGTRIYGSDGFFIVGSNGAIQAQSPRHRVGLSLTPDLRNGKVVWQCSSVVPRSRLTRRCN